MKHKRTTWTEEKKNLGRETDEAIGNRLGITRAAVQQVRAALGIEACSPLTPTPPRSETGKPTDESVRHVPLDAGQRQLLTDKRTALGWSQSELAERAGCTLLTIHRIETGKARPNPALLATICKLLGLRYDIDLKVTLQELPAKAQRKTRS